MNIQYIHDGNGKNTGVFIPIEEWQFLKKQFPVLIEQEVDFQLTDEQKKILDERLKIDKKEFISARESLNKIRSKYGL